MGSELLAVGALSGSSFLLPERDRRMREQARNDRSDSTWRNCSKGIVQSASSAVEGFSLKSRDQLL